MTPRVSGRGFCYGAHTIKHQDDSQVAGEPHFEVPLLSLWGSPLVWS